jgi:splicing factor 3A subunit 3
LDHIVDLNKELEGQFSDSDGLLKEELASMRGPNMFGSFYDTLNSTREYHQKFPNAGVAYQARVVEEDINVPFSGEEVFGKYLDLHSFYLSYCNLPNVSSLDQDYLQYLDRFNSFFYIPETSKSSKAYISYVNDLWQYLETFFGRVQPLIDLGDGVKSWREEFEKLWSEGKVSGWKLRATASGQGSGSGSGSGNKSNQELRLGLFNSVDELEALGMERLKQALEAMGLKCGGTLKERADRLWSVRGKKPEEIPQKLKAKSASKDSANGEGAGAGTSEDSRKEVSAWSIEPKRLLLLSPHRLDH